MSLNHADTLAALLNQSERNEIEQLVAQVSEEGASAFSWWSPKRALAIVGVVHMGELLTWVASPAHSQAEAATLEAVITTGLQMAAQTLQAMTEQAKDTTEDLMRRMRH